MEDSRTSSSSLKRPTPPDNSVDSTKRRKRDSLHEQSNSENPIDSTDIASDRGDSQTRKSTSARASGAAPSVNWNSASKAKIRTTLGSRSKKSLYPSTKNTINGFSEPPVDVPHEPNQPGTTLRGIQLRETDDFYKHTQEETSESIAHPSHKTISTVIHPQSSNPTTTKPSESDPHTAHKISPTATPTPSHSPEISNVQVIPDSLTRRLVEGNSSILIDMAKKKNKRSVKGKARDILMSSLQNFICHIGGDGLLEVIINVNSVIARYASAVQAAKAMGALMADDWKPEAKSKKLVIKRFEDTTIVAKKFAMIRNYQPNKISPEELNEGVYGAVIEHLQRLPPMSMGCDPKDLPNFPTSPQGDLISIHADDPGEGTTQNHAPTRADEVFLYQIRQQAHNDTERRAAIHQTEVAYTDCCIADGVYDAIMLALLTQDECREKDIGPSRKYKTPSGFRNWLEVLCLELWTPSDNKLDENYLRIAAELGRAELSAFRRGGVKEMGRSVIPDSSKIPSRPPAEKALLATVARERTVDDKLAKTKTDPLVSTSLFVRPLPFNQGQAEFVALFEGYQTKSISRASNKRGDLHGFGIVDFTTIAEAERAAAELQGALVKRCKISLKPEGESSKPQHLITVSGDGTVKHTESQGLFAKTQNVDDDIADQHHAKPVDLSTSELSGSAPIALVGGDLGSNSNEDWIRGSVQPDNGDGSDDGQVDDIAMAGDTETEAVAVTDPNKDKVNSPLSETAKVFSEEPKYNEADHITEDIKDSGSDAMLLDYSQSDRVQISRVSGAGSQDAMDDHGSPSTSPKELYLMHQARLTVLADLPDSDLELQLRYEFAPNGKAFELDLQQPTTCLICRGKGHMANICPGLTCRRCDAHKAHPARACPKLRRCQRCRERGHNKSNCTSKIACSAKADGVTCDLCQAKGHLEGQCSKLWQTFDPDAGPKVKVKHLLISCYECGKRGHYGGDCPERPPGKGLAGGTNIWTLDYVKRCFDLSELDPYCLDPSIYSEGKSRGKSGLPVKSRANQAPIVLESDSDRDGSNFYQPKVAAQVAPRGQIRIATNGFTGNNGSSWTPINQPYDDRAPHRSYRDQDDHYRPVGRPGDYSHRRSRSPEPPHPVRVNRNQYRPGPSGIDRSQPPLPREPVPTRGTSRGRARGSARAILRGSDSRRGETYRPMPSAAKNAYKKHLR
ncbi:MAG: hypothetical protein M1812_003703 [Candelaria pacifica]|nr:MAG: hypothetical protein M1812_003703 [Candelaria pacifica]